MIKSKQKMLILFIIIQCLFGVIFFSSATWSWLSGSVESGSNVISSSTFDIDVFVLNEAEESLEADETNEYGYLFHIDNQGIYTVTIASNSNSTAKNGYCKIVANKSEHLAQCYYKVVSVQGEVNDTLTFEIEILQDDVSLLFIPCIGMSTLNSFEANEGYLAIDFK